MTYLYSHFEKKKVFYTYGNVEGMFVFLNNNSLISSRRLTLIIVGWMVRIETYCNLKKWSNLLRFFQCVLEKSLINETEMVCFSSNTKNKRGVGIEIYYLLFSL